MAITENLQNAKPSIKIVSTTQSISVASSSQSAVEITLTPPKVDGYTFYLSSVLMDENKSTCNITSFGGNTVFVQSSVARTIAFTCTWIGVENE